MTKRFETKTIAAAGGAGGGGIFGTLIIWALGAGLFGAGWSAGQVDAAIAAVPYPLAAVVPPVLGTLGALWAGWAAPHTERTPTEIQALAEATGYVGEHRPVQ